MNFEIKINERLSLKFCTVEDAEKFFLLSDKNRDHLRSWLPWVDVTLSVDDTKKYLEGEIEKFNKKTGADFGIWYDGAWIGRAGFHTIKTVHEYAEIGYWIDKDYEGKGIMNECVKAVIRYGFNDLKLHRIQIKCDSSNSRSKAIPERLGFTLEGRIRESRKRNEEFSDMLVYGLLKKEWQA
ncbi:MAG: GNAT family N-acetyltransferase [Candidatus Pacebacteria bacterium]|nr:GNAT family N-acetyltransferase [Candidatus Paceibacterota bacterium]MBP9867217.1 GNAT family N-acetyltransferase [Candidatus Paceibacterota bacterium]